MDLIDRAVMIRRLKDHADGKSDFYKSAILTAVMFAEEAPTVEAVPVVHGKWIMKDSGLWQECSVCGVAVEVDSMYMCKASEDINFNYCPHCGAKMEG